MWILGFILGTVLGSFAKAMADRSLSNQTLFGRSVCIKCKHKLAWYDLIPLFSYIFLSGKCRYCHKKLGKEYLIVEIVMGLLISYLFFQSFTGFDLKSLDLGLTIFLLELIFKVFFITVLVILFLTDLKDMFIPDKIVLPSILIALVLLILITLSKIGYLYQSLSASEIGKLLLPPQSDYFLRHALIFIEPLLFAILMAAIISGFFYLLIVVTRGKGMGGGDVKLGALMGLCLGFPYAVIALMIAFFTGAIWGGILILIGKKRFGQVIAFGPFLVLGSLIALLFGEKLLNIYLKIGT